MLRAAALPAVLGTLLLAGGAARAQFQLGAGAAPQPGIINMSLMEALVVIRRPELAGVFSYVPEAQSTVAMADYLLRDPASLKRWVKKAEADLDKLKVVDGWDKEVCLHIVAAAPLGTAPPGAKPLPKRLFDRIARISLAQAVPLQVILQRRAEAR